MSLLKKNSGGNELQKLDLEGLDDDLLMDPSSQKSTNLACEPINTNWFYLPLVGAILLNILLLFPFEFSQGVTLAAYSTAHTFDYYIQNVGFPFIFQSMLHWHGLALMGFALSALAYLFACWRIKEIVRHFSGSQRISGMVKVLGGLAFMPVVLSIEFGSLFTYNFISTSLTELFTAVSIGMSNPSNWLDVCLFSGVLALLCGMIVLFLQLIYQALNPALSLRFAQDGLFFNCSIWKQILGERFVTWDQISTVSMPMHPKRGATLKIKLKDGSSYEFEQSVLKKNLNLPELLNELKTYASGALDESCLLKNESNQSEYTELWLRYFTTSNSRERSGALQAGEKLNDGKYQIAGELGQGGQGTAYLAAPIADPASGSETDHGVTIVLKEYILPLHRGEEIFQQSLRKLQQEADILSRIQHPNIVELKETFVEDHRGYLVLEYVEGEGLKQLVQSRGPLPEQIVIEIAIQICNALEYMHNLVPAVIHRDLTPDNLILQPGGRVKLVDFNVAHQLESSATASVVGKHAYIPPEQFRGKPSPQSDIFAFGGTLHYLLTGQDPEPMSVSHPRKINAAVSEELDAIIDRATKIEQKDRYQNAFEVRGELFDLARKRKYVLNDSVVADSGSKSGSKAKAIESVDIQSGDKSGADSASDSDTDSNGVSINFADSQQVGISEKEKESISSVASE